MPFLEIAFRAELDRHEDPESAEQARLLCDEHPETRAKAIEELRQLIYERAECVPHRMDDAYLVRFLRARRFIPALAHRLMVRYCQFREQNRHLWENVDAFGLARVGNVYESTMYDRPDVGRLTIMRFGIWDPTLIPIEDLVRAAMLMLEIGIMQPRIQVLGGTALVDLEGLGLHQVRKLTSAVASQIVHLMGVSFPAHIRGCHIINHSMLLNTVFYLFKRVIPSKVLDRVYFHGYDLNSLHKYIPPACLPERYGGYCRVVSVETWLTKIKGYKDQAFDDELISMGYSVKG